MNSTDLKHALRFYFTPGIGRQRFIKLCAQAKSTQSWPLLTEHPMPILLTGKAQQFWKDKDPDVLNSALKWLETKPNRHCLIAHHSNYPNDLHQLYDPPAILWCEGDLSLLELPTLAIVGARNMTAYGKKNAEQFAECLAKLGVVIVSGLALGIDGTAHQGALNANGKTIAILGSGLDSIYPRQYQQLAKQIRETGLMLSEYPPWTQPKAYHFPERNRLISALSMGVLVIESGTQSGSLITARCALEQGRAVFALPGSIHNPLSRGNHQLLREGATLVETCQDILQELALPFQIDPPQHPIPLGKKEQQVLSLIDSAPTPTDSLLAASNLGIGELSEILMTLQNEARISPVPGGFVRVG